MFKFFPWIYFVYLTPVSILPAKNRNKIFFLLHSAQMFGFLFSHVIYFSKTMEKRGETLVHHNLSIFNGVFHAFYLYLNSAPHFLSPSISAAKDVSNQQFSISHASKLQKLKPETNFYCSII